MPQRFRVFAPVLAGATLYERLIACAGALVGIGLTSVITGLIHPGAYLPLIVAPMGATAVLLFAVPTSPLAQPWSIVGGNTISAFVGVAVAHAIDDPALGAALAVSLAILVMSFTRCLHPPGGASALSAVLGGPIVEVAGWQFPIVPVALNSLIIVGVGLVVHKLTGRAYPHTPSSPAVNTHQTLDPPTQLRSGFRTEDIDAALRVMHETFDVSREDVTALLRQVELQATIRLSGPLTCGDIMARDVVSVEASEDVESARSLLAVHDVRVLPVIGDDDKLIGIVSLRELAHAEGPVAGCLAKATTASADDPAIGLVPALTNASVHAVVIIDAEWRVRGIVTQTDLLVAMTTMLVRGSARGGAV